MILLTLGLNNNSSLGHQLEHPSLSYWKRAKTITSRIRRSRGSPASPFSIFLPRPNDPDREGKQIAVALWHLGLGIFMKEPDRKGKYTLAVAQFCIVVVPDRAATINNKMLAVTLNA